MKKSSVLKALLCSILAALLCLSFSLSFEQDAPGLMDITVNRIDLRDSNEKVVSLLGRPTKTTHVGGLLESSYGTKIVTLANDSVVTIWGDTVYANGRLLFQRGDSLPDVFKKLGKPDRQEFEQAPGEDEGIDVQVYVFPKKTLRIYSLDSVVSAFKLARN